MTIKADGTEFRRDLIISGFCRGYHRKASQFLLRATYLIPSSVPTDFVSRLL